MAIPENPIEQGKPQIIEDIDWVKEVVRGILNNELTWDGTKIIDGTIARSKLDSALISILDKIGEADLNTTAITLSEAINEILNTQVSSKSVILNLRRKIRMGVRV